MNIIDITPIILFHDMRSELLRNKVIDLDKKKSALINKNADFISKYSDINDMENSALHLKNEITDLKKQVDQLYVQLKTEKFNMCKHGRFCYNMSNGKCLKFHSIEEMRHYNTTLYNEYSVIKQNIHSIFQTIKNKDFEYNELYSNINKRKEILCHERALLNNEIETIMTFLHDLKIIMKKIIDAKTNKATFIPIDSNDCFDNEVLELLSCLGYRITEPIYEILQGPYDDGSIHDSEWHLSIREGSRYIVNYRYIMTKDNKGTDTKLYDIGAAINDEVKKRTELNKKLNQITFKRDGKISWFNL